VSNKPLEGYKGIKKEEKKERDFCQTAFGL